jgi:hypothetical protein
VVSLSPSSWSSPDRPLYGGCSGIRSGTRLRDLGISDSARLFTVHFLELVAAQLAKRGDFELCFVGLFIGPITRAGASPNRLRQ